MQYLRLDMYINSKEILIGEDDATEAGFESILNLTDIIDSRIAEEIRTSGVSSIPAELRTETILNLIWEMTDIDAQADDEINFCMCLWERDEETLESEHLFSAYTINQLSQGVLYEQVYE